MRSMRECAVVILEDVHWPTEQLDKAIGGHICRRMRLNMSGAVRNVNYLPQPYINLHPSLIPYLAPGHLLSGGWTWSDHCLAQQGKDNG